MSTHMCGLRVACEACVVVHDCAWSCMRVCREPLSLTCLFLCLLVVVAWRRVPPSCTGHQWWCRCTGVQRRPRRAVRHKLQHPHVSRVGALPQPSLSPSPAHKVLGLGCIRMRGGRMITISTLSLFLSSILVWACCCALSLSLSCPPFPPIPDLGAVSPWRVPRAGGATRPPTLERGAVEWAQAQVQVQVASALAGRGRPRLYPRQGQASNTHPSFVHCWLWYAFGVFVILLDASRSPHASLKTPPHCHRALCDAVPGDS